MKDTTKITSNLNLTDFTHDMIIQQSSNLEKPSKKISRCYFPHKCRSDMLTNKSGLHDMAFVLTTQTNKKRELHTLAVVTPSVTPNAFIWAERDERWLLWPRKLVAVKMRQAVRVLLRIFFYSIIKASFKIGYHLPTSKISKFLVNDLHLQFGEDSRTFFLKIYHFSADISKLKT